MTADIYKTPNSSVEATSTNREGETIKMYSPTQVACGTIGGPVGLIYFLRSNFSALNKEEEKKKTLIFGAIFMVLLIALLPLLPEGFSGMPFTIAYIIVARQIADKYQMTKVAISESNQHEFHSSWRVLGMGLLCLAGSFVIIAGPLIVLAITGVWDPA
jgi:hypothetical protein